LLTRSRSIRIRSLPNKQTWGCRFEAMRRDIWYFKISRVSKYRHSRRVLDMSQQRVFRFAWLALNRD
jgi:hypothetical protein